MRSREIWREAARNFGSGASRGLISMAVFMALVLLLGIVATRGVVGVAQDAAEFRNAGASVFRLDAPGNVDSAACDDLARVEGVVAAGATRASAEVRFALLPDLPTPYFDASPGMPVLLGADPVVYDAGIIVDARLAASLGIDDLPGTTFLATNGGSPVTASASFVHPDDGRDSTLAGAALGVVADQEPFDSCWVRFWPPTENPLEVMGTAVISASDGGVSDVTQWNLSLGRTLDPGSAFASLPLAGLSAVGAAVAATLAYVSVRLRRLELASALHVGVARSDLVRIALAESAFWLVPACAFALTALAFVATWSNPDPALAAGLAGARAVGVAAGAWILTIAAATAAVRETHLVHYFQQR